MLPCTQIAVHSTGACPRLQISLRWLQPIDHDNPHGLILLIVGGLRMLARRNRFFADC
jgi:hypothetical protein